LRALLEALSTEWVFGPALFFRREIGLLLRQKTEKAVFELCEPVTESYGLELVQVQYRREDHGWVLRILVDRPGGVSVDECGSLSREVSDLLDVEDFIDTSYNLEVSSPGLDRPLTKPEDFERFAGQEITVKTASPVDGRRNFKGILEGIQDEVVMIESDGKKYELNWSLVLKANLVPNFNERKQET
jgi:ribosome maturation factor RimP